MKTWQAGTKVVKKGSLAYLWAKFQTFVTAYKIVFAQFEAFLEIIWLWKVSETVLSYPKNIFGVLVTSVFAIKIILKPFWFLKFCANFVEKMISLKIHFRPKIAHVFTILFFQNTLKSWVFVRKSWLTHQKMRSIL